MADAELGYGARFSVRVDLTYTPVANVTSLTPPGMTRDTVESTHLLSGNKVKDYIPGLIDAGEATITINFQPSLTDMLLDAFLAEEGFFRITFPDATKSITFGGIVTGYEFGDIVADDKMSATFTVKATSLIEVAATPT